MAANCASLLTLVVAGIFLRATISLHSYSGEATPPMFGDFEAQRHWQEVTVNLPIRDWYQNTTDNDLLYWGLDYPPLTAYHSYLVGKWAQLKDDSFVKLHVSRGITNPEHKCFMRNTVLLADVLLYIPAVLIACYTIRKRILGGKITGSDLLCMTLAVLYPGQILIDNGHFQYNNVSLGLAAVAIAAVIADRNFLGAVLFVLALNYKQMELYHALPFFFYLLQWCFRGANGIDYGNGVLNLLKLGTVVIGTFAFLWSPWLVSWEASTQIIHRVFPIARGVFEDKVSNVWCVVNIFIKLKNLENAHMTLICLICTLTAVLPSSLALLFKNSKRNFLLALINSSLGFFLFSYQVHEKSILLASLPVLLFFQLSPLPCFWFLQISTFSMIPLLHKDNLLIAYIALTAITLALLKVALSTMNHGKSPKNAFLVDIFNIESFLQHNSGKVSWKNLVWVYGFYGSLVGQTVLLIAYLNFKPPTHLPFLWPLLISAYSCAHFVMFFIYFNYIQFFSYDNAKIFDKQRSTNKKAAKRKFK
ncbi:probable dolichyl pyrophosphate Man9GlcNAc2 alpha-1,3-glucosyltransferase [Topomyia yanbarensis]|uniref:probable dolichyl pyrophosphate Man9GlcNAc2 alpha-1,3-glucosyltransferase n=1 Tax=Topomyia yanbarensis TaxID=2498891 RepID=UPI00273C2EF5|nr:probable dolichyl pyrophosphate Man9GlcNAc2 alpha-1,3-glucosyltransferase [Topomyia yanbarensis]